MIKHVKNRKKFHYRQIGNKNCIISIKNSKYFHKVKIINNFLIKSENIYFSTKIVTKLHEKSLKKYILH